jgi:diaminopimelate epimerase
MIVPFTKASAYGNDFLICDRHNGIGADGIEWLFPAQDADIQARLINADGGEAEVSGNGTRCVAAYLVAGGKPGRLVIGTGAGLKRCELISHNENVFEFEMDVGRPQVGEQLTLKLPSADAQGTPVSMGNPHFSVLVPEFPAAWQAKAAEIRHHHRFTNGTNVEFVKVKGRSDIEVHFYERGVGETQSSGTGSCAAAVAAIAAGLADSPVTVHAPGGSQLVRWSGNQVFLRGAAQLIFRGEFFA